jgi:aryl-alcohol dehydrogenase-like predicted oxidoreductase
MIGFGCYRITDVNPAHAEAVERARELGVTLFDTSSNYGDGASERLAGKAAGAAFITKYGYIQGSVLEQIKAQESMGREIPDLVKLSDSLWHCIHPEFLEQAFQISCERMNRTSLDVVLLHNPEYYLQHAHQAGIAIGDARDELYRRFTDAFRWFEQTIAGGRLRAYGVTRSPTPSMQLTQYVLRARSVQQKKLVARGTTLRMPRCR